MASIDRQSGALVSSFGGNGRYAGQLHWIDAIKVDSRGNVYTGEVEDGKRVQKFVPVREVRLKPDTTHVGLLRTSPYSACRRTPHLDTLRMLTYVASGFSRT